MPFLRRLAVLASIITIIPFITTDLLGVSGPLALGLGEEPANLKKVVPISQLNNFVIHHNKTFLWHKGALNPKVFHSFVPTKYPPGYRVVYRVWEKEKGLPLILEAISVTKTFHQINGTHRTLGSGEDPRAFSWNESSYCLTWLHKENDWDHRMINLDTGGEFPLNHCVGGFRGKNWTPLVYKNQLHVIYRIDPVVKWFEYDLNNGCGLPPVSRNDEEITGWRGGSNFVPYGPTSMIGIGRQTVDKNTHVPYLIHIDMDTNQTRRVELARKPPGILDPTSLWRTKDNRFWIGGVHTSGQWYPRYFNNCEDCYFNMSIYEIDFV